MALSRPGRKKRSFCARTRIENRSFHSSGCTISLFRITLPLALFALMRTTCTNASTDRFRSFTRRAVAVLTSAVAPRSSVLPSASNCDGGGCALSIVSQALAAYVSATYMRANTLSRSGTVKVCVPTGTVLVSDTRSWSRWSIHSRRVLHRAKAADPIRTPEVIRTDHVGIDDGPPIGSGQVVG